MPRPGWMMTERDFWLAAANFFTARAAMPMPARRLDIENDGDWGLCRFLREKEDVMSLRARISVTKKIKALVGKRTWAFRCSRPGDLRRAEYAKKQARRKS